MAGKIIKTLALILVISINTLSGSDITGIGNTGYKDIAPVPTLNVSAIKHTIEGSSYLEKEYRMTTSNILSTFDEAKFTKFAKDLQNEEFFGFLTAQINNAELERRIKAWDLISGLPQTVRTKVLNLEVAGKLDNIGLHNNLSEAYKRIGKIVANLDGGGSTGVHLSNRIKSADLDEIEGLTNFLNKSTDPGCLNAAKQPIDKTDEALVNGVPKNRLVFEDEVSGSYDVDFGIKSTSGTPHYETGYQLKSAGTPNAVKNNLGSNQVTQIMNSPSVNKVYEVEVRTGSFSEVENISDFWTKLNVTKSAYPDLQIQVKDLNGVIKIE